MRQSISKSVLSLIALLSLSGMMLVFSGGHQLIASAQGMHHSGTPMPGMMGSYDFDAMFLDMMIVHHEGAIAMANMALTDSEHPEIRALAQTIISDQQTEIDQMKNWRTAWYPDLPSMPMDQMTQMWDSRMGTMHSGHHAMATPGMGAMGHHVDMGGMMSPEAVAQALHDQHGPIDLAFIDSMIAHHQSGVAIARVALQNAQHAEIRTLAQTIIDTQDTEIAHMQTWRTEWYGAADDANVQIVDVTLSEFAVQASLTTFEPNVVYRFVVTNTGLLAHEFMIMPPVEHMGQMDMETLDAMAVVMIHADDLPAGATQQVDVVFTGEMVGQPLELVCALPGHYDAGMTLGAEVVPAS